MIIIKPTKWADVEPGSMILGTDTVLREVGEKDITPGTGFAFRHLGGEYVKGRADKMVLAVMLVDDDSQHDVPSKIGITFMRAGLTVEFLPL